MGKTSAAIFLAATVVAAGTSRDGPAPESPATTAIKVDQVGYFPDASKIAYVVADSRVTSFQVLRNDGTVEFTGRAGAPVQDPDSGDRVQALDFSSLRRDGVYLLDVPGAGRSWPFTIGRDAYDRAYFLTMRSYYGQRCGTAVDLGPDFPGYHHGICHTRGAYHATSGKSGEAPSHYGWHDAGDYGRYMSTAEAAGTLLWAWSSSAIASITSRCTSPNRATARPTSSARSAGGSTGCC